MLKFFGLSEEEVKAPKKPNPPKRTLSRPKFQPVEKLKGASLVKKYPNINTLAQHADHENIADVAPPIHVCKK